MINVEALGLGDPEFAAGETVYKGQWFGPDEAANWIDRMQELPKQDFRTGVATSKEFLKALSFSDEAIAAICRQKPGVLIFMVLSFFTDLKSLEGMI
jgi:hypothetical protein